MCHCRGVCFLSFSIKGLYTAQHIRFVSYIFHSVDLGLLHAVLPGFHGFVHLPLSTLNEQHVKSLSIIQKITLISLTSLLLHVKNNAC